MLGKVKYMKAYGVSIHCAAAYVIGRRGLGFHERLPKSLREKYYFKKKDGAVPNARQGPWRAYKYIYDHIRCAPTAFWYGDVEFKTWEEFKMRAEGFKTRMCQRAAAREAEEIFV